MVSGGKYIDEQGDIDGQVKMLVHEERGSGGAYRSQFIFLRGTLISVSIQPNLHIECISHVFWILVTPAALDFVDFSFYFATVKHQLWFRC